MTTHDDQPTTSHPALGLPHELLAELASTDWHAAHPDVPERDHATFACACATPATLGDFAVRLLTGQAPMSTTRDGDAVAVFALDPAAGPAPLRLALSSSAPDQLDDPQVAFTLHGRLTTVPETDPDAAHCTDTTPHQHTRREFTGFRLFTHEGSDAHDALHAVITGTGDLLHVVHAALAASGDLDEQCRPR